jgi:hypothetical protein
MEGVRVICGSRGCIRANAPSNFQKNFQEKSRLANEPAFVYNQQSAEEFGSPGRIRTGDLSINSRMLYR